MHFTFEPVLDLRSIFDFFVSPAVSCSGVPICEVATTSAGAVGVDSFFFLKFKLDYALIL